MLVPSYSPDIKSYIHLAAKQLEDGWVSNHGPCIGPATEALAALTGIPYCILMSNGTAATECLLIALKYKHPEIKNIIIPDRTFISPWSAAFRIYGEESIYAIEVDPLTLNLAPDKSQLDRIPPDSCLVCVHNIGSIVDVDLIHSIRPDVVLLEDNCEGFLGRYNGSLTGSSDNTLASALSFYGNKIMTTGEGGAFLTRDQDVHNYIKRYYSHGMGNERYVHPIPGSNLRMTNVAAALLHEQVLRAEYIHDKIRSIHEAYSRLLEALSPRVRLVRTDPNTEKSYWMTAVLLEHCGEYIDFEQYMLDRGIEMRPIFPSYKKHAFLANIPLIKLEGISQEKSSFGCLLPSGPGLSDDQQIFVVKCINEYLDK